MSKQIIYTTHSKECLKNILIYISINSSNRGYDFIEKIIIAIDKLILFPNIGIEIEHNRRKLLIDKNYKVLYRIDNDKIYILYVGNVKTIKLD